MSCSSGLVHQLCDRFVLCLETPAGLDSVLFGVSADLLKERFVFIFCFAVILGPFRQKSSRGIARIYLGGSFRNRWISPTCPVTGANYTYIDHYEGGFCELTCTDLPLKSKNVPQTVVFFTRLQCFVFS